MYLGIDLGTSELKLLLLTDRHQVLASTSVALSIARPHALWSEQEPGHWWDALGAAMSALAAKHGAALRQVRAIGLSGQMHGAVLLDHAGAVLRPAILWNDGRSAAQCEALTRAMPTLTNITGNLAMPGFTAPKLLWVRDHEPEVFARIATVLLPKDYLRYRLTGERCTDYSDASGTLWLDVGKRRWSTELLAACDLAMEHMPALVDGSAVSGYLRPAIAASLGLAAGVPVAGGAGDNAASALGMGRVATGQGFVSLGTSGVVFINTEAYQPNPEQAVHAFCHALPGRWHQMSVMLSAASAVNWACGAIGIRDAPALLAAAQTLGTRQCAEAPVFLPYLSGERSPHNNPFAQAVWFGLTASHGQAALAYAVVEGVCFGLRDGLQTLSIDGLAGSTELSLVGGGARNTYWSQLLSSVLGVPLSTHDGAQAGAALGAARLAWLADGGPVDEVLQLPAVAARYQPQAAIQTMLAQRHAQFQALYRHLRPCFNNGREAVTRR